MSKTLKVALGFAVSGFCLWFTFKNFDSRELEKALITAQWGWFLPATGVYLLGHVGRTYRWRIALSPMKVVRPLELFPVLMFGFLINNVLPLRAGEVARAFAANRKTGIPVSSCLGSIAVERLSDFVGMLTMMTIASRILPPDRMGVVLGILLAGGVGLFAIMGLSKRFAPEPGVPSTPIGRLMGFVNQIAMGFRALQSGRKIGGIVVLSILVWSAEALTAVLISRAFGLDLSFVQSAALLVGLSLGVMIPAAPGYVGTYELFGKQALTLLGFAPDLSLSFVLVLHFYQLVVTSLLGLPILLQFGFPSKNKPALAE